MNPLIYRLILFFCLSLVQLQSIAQADSTIIRNYNAATYEATAFNYSAIENDLGVMFFANESGVLHFDGSQWRLITLENFSSANSLLIDDSRIYVGGRNEFGYLEKDSLGFYDYKSLRHLLKLKDGEVLTDIWQVISYKDDIYFSSYERILRFDGENIYNIPSKESFIFKIDDKLFASSHQGLAIVENDSGNYVNKDFKFPKDLAFQYLNGIQGENFLITADNGIYLFDTSTYETEKWEFEASDTLQKNSIYHVLIWEDNYVVSTYLSGLVVLNKSGEVLKSYTKENGLLGNDLRELLIDKRGNLWVTSDHGLNYLKSASTEVGKSELITLINQLTLKESEIGLTNLTEKFTAPKDYNGSVIFHFATPGFDKQELEYSYYLEGFEESWSGWKSEIKKEYTNLDGGKYIFHVKSRYQQTESDIASLQLSLPISWYKTIWAYLFVGFMILSLISYAIIYRTKRLQNVNKKLENIIYSRTKELEMQREQLEIANTELVVMNTELDNFVYRSSHDLVAPLKSLKGLINISELEKDIENQKEYFGLMRASIDKLEDFIKSIMEYSSNNKKAIIQEEIDLNKLLDDIVGDLKYYDRADKISLIRDINSGLHFMSDPRRVKIVLSNLITNSIKYHDYEKENLFIEVKATSVEDFIEVSIIDNGSGIDEAYLDQIFEMFFRATVSAQGSGLGLYIVKDTVKKLGGDIAVASKLGEGTTFSLRFPMT